MALPFLWIHHRRGEGEGGHAAWITACPPHNTAQAYIHPITYTYFHTWRGHSSLTIRVDTTRGATDIGYKPLLHWCRARRQGLLPTVGEILGSHWTAIARLKPGSHQQGRRCPATICHPHWMHGDKGTRKADWNLGTRQPQTISSKQTSLKTEVLKCPANDDRLLCKPVRH